MLLKASVLAGGLAGGADDEAAGRLERYGRAIGLAFQIADDLLDLTATTEELGKDAKSDLKKRKATYPSLLGLEESRRRAAALLDEALAACAPFGAAGEPLAALARFIVERRS
jgi:geranylgeranyl diphosphate synthase type II